MLADLVVLARQQGIDSFDSFEDQFTVWSTEQNAWHRGPEARRKGTAIMASGRKGTAIMLSLLELIYILSEATSRRRGNPIFYPNQCK